MTDRIDPPAAAESPGPWPRVSDTSRLYDHGQPWCVHAAAHPEANGGYPDPRAHPSEECRGRQYAVDGAHRDLSGVPVGVVAYLAAPFRFGAARAGSGHVSPRVVVKNWIQVEEAEVHRFSLSAAEALRLGRILTHLADELLFVGRPAA